MKKQNHVIKKQILDVTLDTEIGSFAFQSKLSEVFKTEILPRIDAHCTRICGTSEILRLDRLELDLGVLNKRNLVKEFKTKFDELFPQKLSTVLTGQRLEGDALTCTLVVQGFHTEGRVAVTRQDRDFELLSHFIKEGRIPWWVKRDELPEIARLMEEMVSKEPAKLRTLLIEIADDLALVRRVLYNANKSTLEKIITLFQPRQAVEACNKLSHDLVEVFGCSPFFSGFSPAKVESEIWLAFLSQFLSSAGRNFNPSTIVENVVKHLAKQFGSDENTLYSYLSEEKKGGGRALRKISLSQPGWAKKRPTGMTSKSWAERVDRYASGYWRQLERIARLINEMDLVLSAQQKLSASSLLDELAIGLRQAGQAIQNVKEVLLNLQKKAGQTKVASWTELEMGEEQRKKVEEFEKLCEGLYLVLKDVLGEKEVALGSEVLAKAEEIKAAVDELRKKAQAMDKREPFTTSEEIFLRNAGLVLLWPYLPSFFERTGLVKEQKFVSEEAQEQAVLLLHYLTFGLEKGQEYEMTLNKILCGFEPVRPVNPCLAKLTAAEIREGENLLQAVIHNWPVLKKMSVPALRSMFLRREGMLFTRDGCQVLKVAEKTYDILLDQIPWGIGTVRLPWMEHLLLVEWRM